ncbi:hypothetical protein [Streptomyces vietnamensis]|uniref:hypothetical protein n=1 Tax=Streptomyces vietnamensis TaxID=362257 RepID=UPI0006971F11|nr:hypothetical protein [Streptomyces vietnamensis]
MRDLACEADATALSSAGLRTVGGVVPATTTPDRPYPAAAPEVAHRLGLGQVPAFDISAVCSGFVYATAVADGLIAGGGVDSVLIVASEIHSRIVDPTDRGTAVVFGDGAGAVVLRCVERRTAGSARGPGNGPGAIPTPRPGLLGDEAGFTRRPPRGRTWGRRGCTPVVTPRRPLPRGERPSGVLTGV